VTARLAFARNRGVRHTQNAREGPPLEALRARRKRCAEAQVRGGDSPAERRREPSLGSARSRRIPCFFGSMTLCGSSAHAVSRKRRRGGRRRQGGSHLLPQHEESMQLVVGARTSSYCRSRKDALGLREARHPGSGPGRKPAPLSGARERESDRWILPRRVSAGEASGKRGAVQRSAANPHHVSAGAID